VRICIGAARSRETLRRGLALVADVLGGSGEAASAVVWFGSPCSSSVPAPPSPPVAWPTRNGLGSAFMPYLPIHDYGVIGDPHLGLISAPFNLDRALGGSR